MVIAIIAILASVLLPTLSKAKATAQGIACVNNLRQLQLSYKMYTDDHGLMPLNLITWNPGNAQSLPGSWVLGNARTDTSTTNIRRGSLYPYVNADDVYRCPADKARVRASVSQPWKPRSRSYAIELTLNGGFEKLGPPTRGTHGINLLGREETVLKPSQSFVFVDLTSESIDGGAYGLYDFTGNPASPSTAFGWAPWGNLPADRHGGVGTLSYVDGRVVGHRWRYVPKSGRPFRSPFNNAKEIEDARWLVRQTVWYHQWLVPNYPGCQ